MNLEFGSSINIKAVCATLLSGTTVCAENLCMNSVGTLTIGNLVSDGLNNFGSVTAKKNISIGGNAYYDNGQWKSFGDAATYGNSILFSTAGFACTNPYAIELYVDNNVTAPDELLTFDTPVFKIGLDGNVYSPIICASTCFAGSGAGLTGTASNLTAGAATTASNAACLGGNLANTYAPLANPSFISGISLSNGSDLRLLAGVGSNDTGDIVFYTGDSTANEWARIWSTTNGCLHYRTALDGLQTRTIYHSGNISGATIGNATCLNGQLASYYQTSSNAITTSNIGSQTVATANNSTCLNGQLGSYYQPASTAINSSNIGSQTVSRAWYGKQLEAFTGADWTGGDHYLRAIRGSGWTTRLYMGYAADQTLQDSVQVNYANTAGSAPANGGTSAAITINYNNDSNSTYQVLWGSSTSVYGTAGVYINPYYDYLYATDVVANSDCRLKKDIEPITTALSMVTQLQGVYYRFCSHPNENMEIGFIAQDVEKVVPAVVVHSEPTEDDKKYGITDSKLGIKYEKLTAILVEAIKEQQKQIEALQIEINNLK